MNSFTYLRGGIFLMLKVTESVLNRNRIEDPSKTIEQQKKQLEAIIENISDALFIFQKDGQFIQLNKEARNNLYPYENVKDIYQSYSTNTFYNLDESKIPFEEMPSAMVLSGKHVLDKHMRIKNEYSDVFVSANGTPIYDDNGDFAFGIVSYRNITEHINSDNMKEEFISLISHELKTPLTVINSAVQALEFICKDELSVKAKGFIQKIKQNSLRQLRLVNNLLEINRANAGQIKIHKKNLDIVFLTKAIIESVYLYAQQKDIKLVFVSTFGHKIIGIDDEKYERILLNLLSNAIKFTPKAKSITTKVCSKKGNLCIEVRDEGIGIPSDRLDLIFKKFGQVDSSLSRQAEGSGIGLSLVKMLVEVLGGKISVKSKEGKGTIFTVLLPSTKVVDEPISQELQKPLDNRLVNATAIEFSDIYLT
jgi:signal transduction histidine kinase